MSSETTVISGGLLKIFGVGVLIRGDSGIGKSESSLELITRGHHFISDDVTLIEKQKDGSLQGKAPSMSRYFMEIRGLGIINIEKIFGRESILPKAKIDLVIHLKKWEEGAEMDRLGLEFHEEFKVLGVKLPKLSLPVAPGRNIATLIEVASKVHLCRANGYHAAKDIVERLDKALVLKNSESKHEG